MGETGAVGAVSRRGSHAQPDQVDLIRIISGKNRSALRWAAKAHAGQKRKGPDDTEDIYLLHPVAVATVLAGAGADRDIVCAGVLHDTVEDGDITLEDIRGEFGANVAALVGAVTKTREFKNIRLEDAAEAVVAKCLGVSPPARPDDACAVKAADLTVNMTDLVLDAESHGPEHWYQVFGKKRAHRKIAHYLELADRLTPQLGEYPQLALAMQTRAGELRRLAAEFGWLKLEPPVE